MGKFTVCVTTYVIVDADDLDAAYVEGNRVRAEVAAVLPTSFMSDDILESELAGVYECEQE